MGCKAGCDCVKGYVRDTVTNKCIPPSYCPAPQKQKFDELDESVGYGSYGSKWDNGIHRTYRL